jgi:hypothetical protein
MDTHTDEKRLLERLTRILHTAWDPIGCGCPPDEYQAYAAPLLGLWRSSKSPAEAGARMAAYLSYTAASQMNTAADQIRDANGAWACAKTLCTHAVTFDEDEAREKKLSSAAVRERWPRFFGECPRCGFEGIAYASTAHYVYGDW